MTENIDNHADDVGRFNSIQSRLLLGLFGLGVFLLACTAVILNSQLSGKISADVERNRLATGRTLVADLQQEVAAVGSLSGALAGAITAAQDDASQLEQLLPGMLDNAAVRDWVSGGGYWPEPFVLDRERRYASMVWVRNERGELEKTAHYNAPEAGVYHRQSWYAAARFLSPARCYWSGVRSHPVTGQPVVSCSTGVFERGVFRGVAMVELNVQRLADLIADRAGGDSRYAFLVDQFNQLITHPNPDLLTLPESTAHQSVDDLASADSRLLGVAKGLSLLDQDLQFRLRDSVLFDPSLSGRLSQSSYELDERQAAVAALALTNPLGVSGSSSGLAPEMGVSSDPLLGRPAKASLFVVPGSYWKIVTVVAANDGSGSNIFRATLLLLLVPLLLALFVGYLGIRRMVMQPLSAMTEALQAGDGRRPINLDGDRDDELGLVAYWYNRRSQELVQTLDELSRVNKELEYNANYDALTGLHNRRFFEAKLDKLKSRPEWNARALLLLDIDQFKSINESSGHQSGDALLKQTAELLREQLREGDSLARIGGDEFALLIQAETVIDACSFAERLRGQIEETAFGWSGRVFDIACSIGVVHLSDAPGSPVDALRYVDSARFSAKSSGRNAVVMYEPTETDTEVVKGQVDWLFKIRQALKKERFRVEFQTMRPLSGGLARGKKVALETFVRMQDEDGSMVPPGAFLPAAVRYNAVRHIDRWMIDNTVQQLATMENMAEHIAFCSINLSADSLNHVGTLPFIRELLNGYNVKPGLLCFEISEDQVISNLARGRKILSELADMGCLVALDNFGSGMSSYNYLREMPLDFLKIDGQYVRNICRDAVDHTYVRSICDIAHAMGLQVVAEFVEDDTTLAALEDMGVDYAQGFYVARPMSLEQVMAGMAGNSDNQ